MRETGICKTLYTPMRVWITQLQSIEIVRKLV